ncbi:hypothetical protein IT411_03715 [Candidatus Peregrinibacteria bacterium]|nr:hypothetical protein [Candidatus Peregrinibacteria bacterium]
MDDQNPQNQPSGDQKPKMASGRPNVTQNSSNSGSGQAALPKKPKTEKQKQRERERRRRRRRKKSDKSVGKDVPLVLTEKKADAQGLGENIAPSLQKPGEDTKEFIEAPEAKILESETAEAHLLPIEGEHAPELPPETLPEYPLETPAEPVRLFATQPAESKPEHETAPETASEPEQEAEFQSKPEPEVEPQAESETESEPEPVSEPVPLSIEEPVPPVPAPQPEAEPEVSAEAENEPAENLLSDATTVEPEKEEGDRSNDNDNASNEENKDVNRDELPIDYQSEVKPLLSHSQEVFEEEYHPAAEHELEKSNLEEAKKISENLISEPEPYLEELPVKQGILGKMFDWLARKVESRKKPKTEQPAAGPTTEPTKITEINLGGYDPTAEEALPEEKKSGGFGLVEILKKALSIIVLLALIIGAFWLGSSLHLVERVTDLFKTKPGLELAEGTNSEVNFDVELIRKWGFYAAKEFGANLGDSRNTAYAIFTNAYYFGKLRDPIFVGETGISAALYYGFGRDDDYLRNKFIYYVRYLAKIRNANLTDILESLNNKVRRDTALDTLYEDLNNTFDEGNNLRKEINVQVDDLKISFNSLNPDKDRFEADFFISLNQTEAEKADLLINKFIEISQKQVELRAKLAAMEQLSLDYEDELIKLKLKLEGIQKNRAALIEGVTVTEVPGSGVDLVNN